MPSSLEVFKDRLDGALSNLVWWKVSLSMAGGWELDDLSGPFQSKPFHDSMKVSIVKIKPPLPSPSGVA